jgi:hypothetical protein
MSKRLDRVTGGELKKGKRKKEKGKRKRKRGLFGGFIQIFI